MKGDVRGEGVRFIGLTSIPAAPELHGPAQKLGWLQGKSLHGSENPTHSDLATETV